MWDPSGGFLYLTKYIIFTIDLLLDLERSILCCKISGTPSSPADYVDDVEAATVSKYHTDRVQDMVDQYRGRWRFNFNAGKSVVMVQYMGKIDKLATLTAIIGF